MATWEELEARRDELRTRQEELMREKAAMDPLLAARAFRALADEKAALAAEFEAYLDRRSETP